MPVNNQPLNILCTWEKGEALGHITRLANITHKLEQKNHRVTVAAKDLSRAYRLFEPLRADLLQAPTFLPKISMQRPVVCLADTLLLSGYLEPDTLHGLVTAWQALIRLIQPDLIVYDYSPTALLASRGLDIRKIIVGTGFPDPAPGHPLADWRPIPGADTLIARQEARLLEVINTVLKRQQLAPLNRFSDLYIADSTVITTFPELDIYSDVRKGAHYCPYSLNSAQRQPVVFPASGRPKLLAYLKPQYPHLELIVKALAGCDANVFVACPGARDDQLKPFRSPSFNYSTRMVELETALESVDLFVGHGNMGSLTQSLMAGTPVVCFPQQLEQLISGTRSQQQGLGVLINHIESVPALTNQFNAVLNDKALAATARQFAQQNQFRKQREIADFIVTECERICAG